MCVCVCVYVWVCVGVSLCIKANKLAERTFIYGAPKCAMVRVQILFGRKFENQIFCQIENGKCWHNVAIKTIICYAYPSPQLQNKKRSENKEEN